VASVACVLSDPGFARSVGRREPAGFPCGSLTRTWSAIFRAFHRMVRTFAACWRHSFCRAAVIPAAADRTTD